MGLLDVLPWKRKGYKVLDQYDSAEPAEGDHKVLSQLVAMGADLARERHIVHYLYFPMTLRATAPSRSSASTATLPATARAIRIQRV